MVHKSNMEWNTHPSTCLVVTGLAPHHKHKADFLDTLDLRGDVEIAEVEVKFKITILRTKLHTHMRIWTLHQHPILTTTPCNTTHINDISPVLVACLPFHRISVSLLHIMIVRIYIYPDGSNRLFYPICYRLLLTYKFVSVRLPSVEG
jgi:hypothetical protein